MSNRPEPASANDPTGLAHQLLAELVPGAAPAAGALEITGDDPVFPTRYRAGEAAAAVLGAQALAAAHLWTLRGGAPQRTEIDVRAAAASLVSVMFQRVGGKAFSREPNPATALYRARDGRWIHLHGGFRSRDTTLALLECADDADSIARAVSRWDAQALEDALAARGACGARVRDAAEWRSHPQGIALAATPVVELIKIGDAPAEPLPGPRASESSARPLSGVRVLDLTRVLAGPACARTLAEHGADVLHVRSPNLPSIEPFVVDTSAGKRSCFLDLDRREDADQLRSLVGEAHVFSQGYRQGAMARRGFAPGDLARMRPGIVAVSINCYGHEGPWSGRPGWEQLAQTVTGMLHEHSGGENPALVPAALNDYTTGYLAALGATCALGRRAVEGGSWHVRVSLSRTAMWIMTLPRVEAGAARGVDLEALAPWMIEMDTRWGRLARLGPVARMSATPPRWARPPVPLGSDPPRWV